MKKTLLIIPIILIIAAAGYTWYKFHTPAGSIRDLKPEYKISSTQLFNEFQLVEMTSNSKYLNRMLEVNGKVKEVNANAEGQVSVVIDGGNPIYSVICRLAKSENAQARKIKKEDEITLHGICKGITTDVILEDCIINKKTDFVF